MLKWQAASFRSSSHSATSPIPGFPTMATIDGDPKTGWAIAVSPADPRHVNAAFAKPVTTDKDSKIVVHIHQDLTIAKPPSGASGLAIAANPGTWPGTGERTRSKQQLRVPIVTLA